MTEPTERVVQLNRGVEPAAGEARTRGPQHEALEIWVGRWINNGHTINEDGTPGLTITTSDVYEWAPGGFFILHTAFGRAGEHSGGAVEIIGYDDATGSYTSHLYDSQGNVVVSSLVCGRKHVDLPGRHHPLHRGVQRRRPRADRAARAH